MESALTHKLTYWAPGTPDGYGGQTFSDPVTVMGRWEDGAYLFVNPATGQQEVSKARAFSETSVALDGYLLYGSSESTTPQNVDGAWKIMGLKSLKDLDDTMTLYTVYL